MQAPIPASESKEKCCRHTQSQSRSRKGISPPGTGQAHVPLSVPAVSLSAGAGTSRRAEAPCARQRARTAVPGQPPGLPSPPGVPCGTSPSLISLPGAGLGTAAAALGSRSPAGGRKIHYCHHQRFLWGFLHFGPRLFGTSEERNLSQRGHQPGFLLFHQSSTLG